MKLDFATRANDDWKVIRWVMRSLGEPDFPDGLGDATVHPSFVDGVTPVWKIDGRIFTVDEEARTLVVFEKQRVLLINLADRTVRAVPLSDWDPSQN